MITLPDLICELKERIGTAESDARESHKDDVNSYGSGYDRGFADGLWAILILIEGCDEQ